jgi:hypothetical protein
MGDHLSLTKAALFKSRSVRYLAAMSTVKEIEAAIPKLSPAKVEELRAWLENYFQGQQKTANVQIKKRSMLRLHSLSGKWIGETVLKSGDLADEMFARA